MGAPSQGGRELQMIVSFTTTFRRVALMAAVIAPLSSFASTAGLAYTAEAQQMCMSDAFRLCASEIPSIPKITACMVKRRNNLSPGCRAVLDRDAARKSSTVAEQ
jgi:hypothetical protein